MEYCLTIGRRTPCYDHLRNGSYTSETTGKRVLQVDVVDDLLEMKASFQDEDSDSRGQLSFKCS